MNIAAVMAALDIWDLDRIAKLAVVVVACRADRHTAAAQVSTVRIAADLKIHRNTAAKALRRAVDAGYLTVDKSPGGATIWHLTPRVRVHGLNKTVHIGVLGENQGDAAPARHPQGTAGAAPPHFAPGSGRLQDFTGATVDDPVQDAIDACPYCDDRGWLWRDNAVGRCSHRPVRAVTDLTVPDILDAATP